MAAAASSGVVGSAQTDITNPYETIPCGCVYCFVCLATRLEREEGEGWTCLRCGQIVKECKPWNGDVLEPPSKSPSAKTVGFAEDVKRGVSIKEPEEVRDFSEKGVGADESASGEAEPGGIEPEDKDAARSDGSSTDSEVYEEEEGDLGGDLDDEI